MNHFFYACVCLLFLGSYPCEKDRKEEGKGGGGGQAKDCRPKASLEVKGEYWTFFAKVALCFHISIHLCSNDFCSCFSAQESETPSTSKRGTKSGKDATTPKVKDKDTESPPKKKPKVLKSRKEKRFTLKDLLPPSQQVRMMFYLHFFLSF